MLCYRTLGRAVKESDALASDDDIAPRFRDALMPFRSILYRKAPFLLFIYRFLIQSKLFGCPGIVDFVARRTRWFDLMLEKAISEQGIKQVVVIATGFSTYSYRNTHSHDVSFFEVDLRDSIRAKEALVLQLGLETERVTYISADLSQVTLDSALLDTGAFDPTIKTFFLIEGLLYYLPSSAVDQLFDSISRCSSPGSLIGYDFLDLDVYSCRKFAWGFQALRLIVANRGEGLKSGMSTSKQEMESKLDQLASHTSVVFKPLQVLDSRQMANVTEKGRGKKCPIILPSFFHYCLAEAKSAAVSD